MKLKYLSTATLLYIALSSATCGDNNLRCINPNGDVSDDYQRTKECCEASTNKWCWCSHRAEWYCDFDSWGETADFKICCERKVDFSFRDCD